MIVAMVAVGVVQVTIDQVVDVIAVGDGFVAAALAMDVSSIMSADGIGADRNFLLRLICALGGLIEAGGIVGWSVPSDEAIGGLKFGSK